MSETKMPLDKEFLIHHGLPTTCDSCRAEATAFDEEFDPVVSFACGAIFRVGVGWTRWEPSWACAQLALSEAVAEAAGEAVRLCGLDGSLDRVEEALAAWKERGAK